MTSTLKADVLTSKTTNGDLSISGDGSGVPDIEASFKVGSVAGVPMASIRTSSGTASSSTFLRGDGTWQAPSGGAWAVKTSGTASTVSTLSFTGLTKITKIYLTNVTTSTWAALNMRTSSDGGSSYDSGASDYGWVWSGAYSNPISVTDTNSMADSKILFWDSSTAFADNGVIEILTSKPTTATEATFSIIVSMSRSSTTSTVLGIIGQTFGLRMDAADFDAIQIGTSSGTFGCDYTVVELN